MVARIHISNSRLTNWQHGSAPEPHHDRLSATKPLDMLTCLALMLLRYGLLGDYTPSAQARAA
jgi:hypothetical protein